jgi:hypothetical protein
MKKYTTVALIAISIFSGCTKLDIERDTPKCIVKEIKNFKRPGMCDNAEVAVYTFQGKTVYVFSPGNCQVDSQADVLDEECKFLGSLGGFVGNTKINGESFSNAVFLKTIWSK